MNRLFKINDWVEARFIIPSQLGLICSSCRNDAGSGWFFHLLCDSGWKRVPALSTGGHPHSLGRPWDQRPGRQLWPAVGKKLGRSEAAKPALRWESEAGLQLSLITHAQATSVNTHIRWLRAFTFKTLTFTRSYTSFYDSFQALRTKCTAIERAS